jgi:hypothetical protein
MKKGITPFWRVSEGPTWLMSPVEVTIFITVVSSAVALLT